MGCTIGGLGGCANGQGEFIREKRKESREKKKESVLPWCVLEVCLVLRFDLV